MPIHRPRTMPSSAVLLALFCAGAAVAAPTLPLYVGQAQPGARVMFGDFDVQQPLDGANARMPDDPKLPGAVVEARRTDKDGKPAALGLRWKNAWFSTLRLESAPLDLRPYLAHGVVSFDLKVNELATGGLTYRLDCGKDCERKVLDVLPARAAEGKGWRHRSYALRCFYRDGDDVSAVTQPFALDGTGRGDVEVANVRIDTKGKPTSSCPDYRTASTTPEPLGESWALDWWLPRHEEKLAEIARRKAAGERTDLVLIGDSITHNWEKQGAAVLKERFARYNPLDLGYGGDRTENVLWRLQHGEIDGIDPKVAVLMIGTNNAGHRHEAPELTFKGIARDVQEIRKRLPRTKLLVLAIFPRGERQDDGLRRLNERVNAMLPTLADGKSVFFLNINDRFLQPDGTLSKTIMPDLLHPEEQGYRIWADAMQPELDRLMR
jgi:lysophospholipase L1-like esterase